MIMVELLERIYRNRLPLLNREEQYRQALEEIRQQVLAGQVYALLQERDFLAEVPHFFRAALLEAKEKAALFNLMLKSEADRILAELERRGIEVVVLKGVWLSRLLYGSIGIRSTTDVDLLVKPEDVARASEALKDLRFQACKYESYAPYHQLFIRDGDGAVPALHLELHWDLLKTEYSRHDCRKLWAGAIPLEPYATARQLAIPDLFYELCIHGAKHVMSNLKYALDLVAMIHSHKEAIDYGELLARAREEHTSGMVVMALTVTYKLFPHLHAVKPFGEIRDRLRWNPELAWRLERDQGRFKGLLFYWQQTIFQFSQLEHNRYRFKYLRSWVCPHPGEMRHRLRLPESMPSWIVVWHWYTRFWPGGGARRKETA